MSFIIKRKKGRYPSIASNFGILKSTVSHIIKINNNSKSVRDLQNLENPSKITLALRFVDRKKSVAKTKKIAFEIQRSNIDL